MIPSPKADHPENYTSDTSNNTTRSQPLSLDPLIKLMVAYELRGLNDIAVDTLDRFADRLKERLDTEHAIQPGYRKVDPPIEPQPPTPWYQRKIQAKALCCGNIIPQPRAGSNH